jgi:hypothetical protein
MARQMIAARLDAKSEPGEALKPGRQKRAAPNINCMGQSCGKLEAAQPAQIFLRQASAFWRRMRGGEKNVAAMI